MAKATALIGDDGYWLGTDHAFVFTVYTTVDETTCIDITGWTLSFLVKRQAIDKDGTALVTKQSASGITTSGVFNSAPASNTQVATVSLADTDTDVLEAGPYLWELKRIDAGAETVLAYGAIDFLRSVHHA